MAQVNTDDGLLTQGFFKTKFWGKLLGMLSKKLDVTDNGSNLSVTPDGTSTGYDLGSSTTLKAFAQKFKNLVSALKALAFKDKASYNDLSSGVQSSLGKADTALQSHQSVTDNNPTLAWGTTSKVGTVGSTNLRVTMPSNPAQNLPASVITSGTFGTDRIADDAITANKVKDNETLPVNVSGNAATATKSSKSVFYTTTGLGNSARYLKIGNIETSGGGQRDCTFLVTTPDGVGDNIPTTYIVAASNRLGGHRVRYARITPEKNINQNLASFGYVVKANNSIDIMMYRPAYSGAINITMIREGDLVADFDDNADGTGYVAGVRYETVMVTQQVGSTTTPVYVDSNGQVQPCTQGATLKTNTATLYIAGYTDDNIPYYHVKNIKNGCVNHVAFSGITNSTCDITFEAPTLSTGEEYDYIISLEGYTNNSGSSTGSYVENCKQVLRYDYVNNLWIGEPLFLQATDWRQICVVRGNTCEWKRIALS